MRQCREANRHRQIQHHVCFLELRNLSLELPAAMDQIETMTNQTESSALWHGTTILAVRTAKKVVVMSDGQVSMGQTIMKGNARKVRRLAGGNILAGFAGATADAFTLFERLEAKLERYPNQLQRAAVELAKDWRTEKYLQKLEALLIVADKDTTLVITGAGDVLEPEHSVVAVGSGGNYALAAGRGLIDYETDAEIIAKKAMTIAADICVYTNDHFTIESLDL